MGGPGPGLRSVDDHRARILDTIEPLTDFPQPLMEALGLAAAEDVVSEVALPPFDNSAMDGYAVRRDDVVTASDESPVHLPVVGEIGAGQSGLMALAPGTAAKIMTGAPIPAGADSVVPYEWTDRGVAQVRIDRAPALGQSIRPAGEDIAVGRRAALRRHGPRPATDRAAGRGRPGDGAGRGRGRGSSCCRPAPSCATPAPSSAGTRSTTATPSCSPRPPVAPARSPTGSASCPTSRATFLDALRGPAGARRHRGDQRWCLAGRLRRGQGGAATARHRVVRRGRDAAGQAAGLRPRRRGPDADLHAAGQPGLVVRLLRAVRAPRDPQDDGPDAVRPTAGPGAADPRDLLPGRSRADGAGGVRRRRRRRLRHAGRWTRFPPDRRSGIVQRADRGA